MTTNEAFEKYMSNRGYAVSYIGDGQYEFQSTQLNWDVWYSATTEANKRIAELKSEVAELQERLETHIAINKSLLLQRDCLQADVYKYQVETANMSLEIMQLQANNNDLREVLENVLSWVVYQPVACHGMKCRESVCESCCGEEAAEIASKQAGEAVTIARKTLAETPAQSLQAHDNELIEKIASMEVSYKTPSDGDILTKTIEGYLREAISAAIAEYQKAIRALKEVK